MTDNIFKKLRLLHKRFYHDKDYLDLAYDRFNKTYDEIKKKSVEAFLLLLIYSFVSLEMPPLQTPACDFPAQGSPLKHSPLWR